LIKNFSCAAEDEWLSQLTTVVSLLHRYGYTPWAVRKDANFCLYFRKILTDFKTFFTVTLCTKVAVTRLLIIPPHLNYVATLLCEVQIFKNQAIRRNTYAETDFEVNTLLKKDSRSRKHRPKAEERQIEAVVY